MLNKIQQLNGINYHVWALKIGIILQSRKLLREVTKSGELPHGGITESEEGKRKQEWETENDEAFGIIILTLPEDQAGQFLGKTKARNVWTELREIYAGDIEDRRIDVDLKLKNSWMNEVKSLKEYIIRTKGIAALSVTLGQVISHRKITYNIVREFCCKRWKEIASVFRTRKELAIDDVEQLLTKEVTCLG